MPSIKLIILFALVLFGAYTEHEADKTVKKIRSNRERMKQRNETSATDHEFMKRAIALSDVAVRDNHGHPFGSVVVKDGRIIGEGWNKTRILKDPSAHAEAEAIRDACKNLDASDLSGSIVYASAQPCPMCLSLIYLTGIEKVYYNIPLAGIKTINEALSVDHIYEELTKSPGERTIPEIQIMVEEAGQYPGNYTSP